MSNNLPSELIVAVGQYDTAGNYMPYVTPQACSRLGKHLLDKQDGFAVAVLDEYGDWVSPVMKALGIKSKIEVRMQETAAVDPLVQTSLESAYSKSMQHSACVSGPDINNAEGDNHE